MKTNKDNKKYYKELRALDNKVDRMIAKYKQWPRLMNDKQLKEMKQNEIIAHNELT